MWEYKFVNQYLVPANIEINCVETKENISNHYR